MQYNKNADGSFSQLAQKNVDTGMGLERTVATLNGKKSAYETDIFAPIIAKIAGLSGKSYNDPAYTRAFRIVADHVRTSAFIIGDQRGIAPSNVDQGYILRRLIRRAIRYGRTLELPQGAIVEIARVIVSIYADAYPEIKSNSERIFAELKTEEERFLHTLVNGLKEFEKAAQYAQGRINGKTAFRLYDTYGFPPELTAELAAERGLSVDTEGFAAAFREHQLKSQAGAEQKFKGGLADNTEATARLHTATHLMHEALRKVLGDTVAQKGSNITAERLRFDFSFARKMEPDEIAQVERLVNDAIKADAPVAMIEMSASEAKKSGAIGLFESKYGEKVKVYTMGNFSKEICGGPHAAKTGELGSFSITKEESSSAGVRRIKAVISNL
jgi:alanyl-tRNA synthetase